jgi:hypothetical protein
MNKETQPHADVIAGKPYSPTLHRDSVLGHHLFMAQQSPAAQHVTSRNLHILCTLFA